MNDPGAARHRNRAIENFAAAGLDAFSRRLDVADVEIVEPERQRRLRIPQAANRLRSVGEELVRAHRVDMSIAANAKYGLQDGSGVRNSMRLARGFSEYIGIRQQAERLRLE